MKSNAMCSKCGTPAPVSASFSSAYDKHREESAIRMRALKVLLVTGDCFLIGMQPILVYMSKVDGKFLFNPVSVNFLTEITKVVFAVLMVIVQARKQRPGEASLLSWPVIAKAVRVNVLLAVPAFLYCINNYLKFVMQLYFKPATVKMLGNLKVLTIAMLLKVVMKRRFSFMQWEALLLLLIGISVNQMPCGPNSGGSMPDLMSIAWVYTCLSVTVPSAASVYNEYALKSQFDTNVHLQNLCTYAYGAIFNGMAMLVITVAEGGTIALFEGHSSTTMLLVLNNALQGILSSFFFKYADTILKKYSSTVATIFTGLASAALFGHAITANFCLGVSIVFISMHLFFSSVSQPKKVKQGPVVPYEPTQRSLTTAASFDRDVAMLEMTMGASEEANHHLDRRKTEEAPLLPR